MLSYIKGKIADAGENTLVVECGGLGYEMTVSRAAAAGASIGDDVKLPVYLSVTENGVALDDKPNERGEVDDPVRTKAIGSFLTHLKRAMDEGIPVLGYQHWSLMDNFEWAEGYGPRFGLVYVDFATQKRTIKSSARRYAEIIANGGEDVK